MKTKKKNHLALYAKRIALSISIVTMSFGANSQTNVGSLRFNARQGQGYLVMNQPSSKTAQYSCWRYQFSQRTGIATKAHPDGIIPLDNITVCGKDYVQIPVSYAKDMTKDIIVTVYGQTKTTEVIVLSNIGIGNYSGPALTTDNPNTWVRRCAAGCDGNNYLQQSYAFQLAVYEKCTPQYPNGSGAALLKVEQAEPAMYNGTPLPYYGYYTYDQANHWLVQKSIFVDVDTYVSTYGNGFGISPKMPRSLLAPGLNINGPDGNPIYDDYFYMIPKDMGPFYASDLQAIPNYTLDCLPGDINLSTYISNMNYYISHLQPVPSGWIPLVCKGNGYSIQEGTELDYDCFAGVSYIGDAMSTFEFLLEIAGCEEHILGNTSSTSAWYDVVSFVNVKNVVSNGTLLHWDRSLAPPSADSKMTVPAGLYVYEVGFKNGDFRRVIVEAQNTFTSVTTMADLVSEVIFPVPIVNDQFSINVETPFDATFTYELWDNKGNKLYTQNMRVATNTGNPTAISVNPNMVLPVGTLINKFIFPDGSVTTIQTTK